jgi:CRP-like cAMP-binding protein
MLTGEPRAVKEEPRRRSPVAAPNDAQSTSRPAVGQETAGDPMATRDEIADALAGMTLFADLATPQLLSVASQFEEAFFPEGARILRQGLTGSAFYVILDGDASVVVDGVPRAQLSRGEFFGEVSILLGEPPTADVIALRPLRCIVLAGAALEAFLIEHPRVTYRMLQAQSRRLRNANRARS